MPDGLADSLDTDDDADGYSDTAEASEPLCGNGLNDDPADDAIVDDGCPAGPSQAGAHAEGSSGIGTYSGDPCGTDAWPADFVSGGIPESTNRVTITDLTSFLAPIRHFNTSPPEPEYADRWDLVPGAGLFSTVINISDLTALLGGPSGYPPMLGGVRAFNGPPCPWPP